MPPRNDYQIKQHFDFPGVFNLFAEWRQEDGELQLSIRQVGVDHQDTLVLQKTSYAWELDAPAPRAEKLVAMKDARTADALLQILRQFDGLLGRG